MRGRTIEREKFLNVLCEESSCPDWPEIKRVGLLILRHAVTHGRLAVAECNGPEHLENPYYWKNKDLYNKKRDEWDAWRKKRETQIERRLFELADSLGVTLSLGGDPRGFAVMLKTPKTKRYNTWGGEEEGWGVPQ